MPCRRLPRRQHHRINITHQQHRCFRLPHSGSAESVESLVIHHVHLDSAAVLLINEIEYLTKRGSLRHSTIERNYAFLSILYTPSNPHHHRVATFRIGFAVRVRRHCNNFRRRCFPCSTDPARRQCFDRDKEKKSCTSFGEKNLHRYIINTRHHTTHASGDEKSKYCNCH